MLDAVLKFNEILLNVRIAYIMLDTMQERVLDLSLDILLWCWMLCGNFAEMLLKFCSVVCILLHLLLDKMLTRIWSPKLSCFGSVCVLLYNYWGWRARGGCWIVGRISIGTGSLCCKRLSNSGSTIHTVKQISVVEEKPFTLSCSYFCQY